MSPSHTPPEPSSPFGRRMVVWTILALLAIPAFFLSLRLVAAWRAGYGWEEMDWAGRGHTSLADVLRAGDIGKRPVNVNGATCTEYYGHRDGVVVKTVCAKE